MKDIKTRESRAGSVKTIDRASMLSYRMKQATIRGKEQLRASTTGDDQNETSYAEEKTLSMAVGSVSAVGNAAASGFVRGRELAEKARDKRIIAGMANEYYQNGKELYENEAVFSENSTNSVNKVTNIGKKTYQNGKLEGKKSTENSKFITKMVSDNDNSRVKISFAPKYGKVTDFQKYRKNATLTQGLPSEKAESVLKRQYRMRKARDNIRRRTEKAGRGFLTAVRKAVESTKFIVGSLSVAGSIALIAIIVCTFFGSAFYILGDESSSDFVPGGFEGIGNEAIVEVAASQVGNKGGGPYWSWYGFNGRVEWCACFVSWCANQCGYIRDGIIPKFAVVGHGMKWFKDRGQFQKRGYHPKPGDIIFFDWDGDGLGNHVGIVESSDDTYVYTIEGNSGDKCCRRTYFLHSSVIMGYGIPKYPTSEKEDGDLRNHPLFQKLN